MSSQQHSLLDLTLPRVLARHVAMQPDKVFISDLAGLRTHTYRSADVEANRVAHALQGLGLAKGRHVALLMENSCELLFCFLGIGKVRAVAVPLNTAARGELLRYYIDQSDAAAVVVDTALLPRLLEVLPTLSKLQHVLVNGQAPALPDMPGVAFCSLHELVRHSSTEAVEADVNCWDLLLLAYTSGTTGPSKANMISHAAALTYGTGSIAAHGYRREDVFYVCLPLFHNNALLAGFGAALVVGGSVALARRFSVSRFWSDVRGSGSTITNLLGSMTAFLWNQPAKADDADNPLRLVSLAPTPLYAAAFERRFALKGMNNYGLSDFGMATAFTAADPESKRGAIGRARAGVEIQVVDEHDFPVPVGVTGEIVLRAQEPWRAASGYYGMPAATVAAWRNGWFHTGDRGFVDDCGYYYFVDRMKDCIRRRGENVSAYEVEQVISLHPAVANVAVFPVSTADGDEEVAAAIVLSAGASVSAGDLVEFCQKNLAYFMVPRFVALLPGLPLTSNQKVEKYRLRQSFESGLAELWDREEAGIRLER